MSTVGRSGHIPGGLFELRDLRPAFDASDISDIESTRVGKMLLSHFALLSKSFDRITEVVNGMHRRLHRLGR